MIIDVPRIEDIGGLRTLWKEAFGDTDAFLDTFFKTAFDPQRCRCVILGGRVVASLYWFDCTFDNNRIAYLYAIATAEDCRGQGLCHQLMDTVHAVLRRQGYAGAMLVPGSESLFEFYRRMGYEVCSKIGEYRCKAADRPITVTRIDRETYARLRREWLPSGGVVQEKENLAFLETSAVFYTGDGFLLAAQKHGDTLRGIELLGNYTAGAGIVRALECQNGIFRIPAGETPFAMYRPLDGSISPTPTYFGLAFD